MEISMDQLVPRSSIDGTKPKAQEDFMSSTPRESSRVVDMSQLVSRSQMEDELPGQTLEEATKFMKGAGKETVETVKDIGQVYPVAEAAANMITSAYGIPLSGIAGAVSLLFPSVGLKESGEIIDKVQKYTIAQPFTERGKHLTEVMGSPGLILDKLGKHLGSKIDDPDLAASVETAITGGPALLGLRQVGLKPKVKIDKNIADTIDKSVGKVDKKLGLVVDEGISQGIRPSVVGKRTANQLKNYKNRAKRAVELITENADNLNLKDASGNPVPGLPKNLQQFADAIEKTKKDVYSQYDDLARNAGKVGVRVDTAEVAKALNKIMDDGIIQDFAPSTVNYAKTRLGSLYTKAEPVFSDKPGIKLAPELKYYTATGTQEAITLLNQSLESFYKDPTPARAGRAVVDSTIAKILREQLDKSITNALGDNRYQKLKNDYGALKAIEKEVLQRSVVDARKNVKGLIDFSDIYSSAQIVRGVLSKDPVIAAGGVTAKGIAKYIKHRNDPNRIISSMFKDVDDLIQKRSGITPRDRATGSVVGPAVSITTQQENTED